MGKGEGDAKRLHALTPRWECVGREPRVNKGKMRFVCEGRGQMG